MIVLWLHKTWMVFRCRSIRREPNADHLQVSGLCRARGEKNYQQETLFHCGHLSGATKMDSARYCLNADGIRNA
jgi:hypothetical protein